MCRFLLALLFCVSLSLEVYTSAVQDNAGAWAVGMGEKIFNVNSLREEDDARLARHVSEYVVPVAVHVGFDESVLCEPL